MKKIFVLTLSVFASFTILGQDNSFLKKEDFNQFQQTIQDSIQQIGRRVDNASEVLNVSKKYVESADKLHSSFISMVDILWAIFMFIAGGIVVTLINLWQKKYEDKINATIKNHTTQLNRLIKTEEKSIYIKENASILVVHKGSHSHNSLKFKTLENTILSEFKGAKHTSVENFKELNKELNQNSFSQHPLKIILLTDDLFNDLKDNKGFFPTNAKSTLNKTFDIMKKNNMGIILFGRTHLDEFNLPFVAFSNQPYSTYTNVNNLLKYMMVALNIKS